MNTPLHTINRLFRPHYYHFLENKDGLNKLWAVGLLWSGMTPYELLQIREKGANYHALPEVGHVSYCNFFRLRRKTLKFWYDVHHSSMKVFVEGLLSPLTTIRDITFAAESLGRSFLRRSLLEHESLQILTKCPNGLNRISWAFFIRKFFEKLVSSAQHDGPKFRWRWRHKNFRLRRKSL